MVCRKCIYYEKITEDEIECCPVCDIDLGGAPLDKLRPDHILQDLRAKIFPLKRKRVLNHLTCKEEREVYLVSGAQTGTTGKRSKSLVRKDVRGNGSFTKRAVKKEEESGDGLYKAIFIARLMRVSKGHNKKLVLEVEFKPSANYAVVEKNGYKRSSVVQSRIIKHGSHRMARSDLVGRAFSYDSKIVGT
ncbi:hypothetical protein Bca52824_004094 [Brassica carinata]|uniref:Uncharacterized protein n=1 Tax=Brassica carinata TaxID=52824 RepID=A0A8X7WNH6_BRACI|nr:hypothetical protein Bca52824_004094 [Brassica carinata]